MSPRDRVVWDQAWAVAALVVAVLVAAAAARDHQLAADCDAGVPLACAILFRSRQ